jgi:hypothetical protein
MHICKGEDALSLLVRASGDGNLEAAVHGSLRDAPQVSRDRRLRF